MNFEIKEGNFWQDGRKVFLNSGEIHYFRIKRELWDTHLSAAVEAGLTTVSTYIPWAWHEAEEGVFDFRGYTLPEKDLEGWLTCCSNHGLHCIVKPGPFILAEFRGAGLPDWFMDKYRDQVKMRNSRGKIVPSDGVSLFNPVYLDKVRRWYDHIMPFLSERQCQVGGPVIMMQICNEIGVFHWLAHQADYNDPVRVHFIEYLRKKYDEISRINTLWGTDYTSFNEIQLPPDGRLPYAGPADRGRDHEWHLFWRRYFGDYLRMLVIMARERGITVPVYHNLPGWIYGNGYEFPVNITMYEDLYRDRSEIVFGVDHIPEFLSYRNLHDDRIINDITAAMQGNKPMFAAEFQCGSREYHVVTNPREMELFYKASLAHGLTGWNYYMFSQGRNAPHKGYSGETFYWFNPLTPEGERTSAFPLLQKMSKILQVNEKLILNARPKAEIGVVFYPPYYATELERPETGSSDLCYHASSIRRPAFFDGLLKVLQVLNTDYTMTDLTAAGPEELGKYKQLWVFATDEMNAADQQKLIDYTRSGGMMVIYPALPDREMNQQSCTLLRDALVIHPTAVEIIDSPLMDVMGLSDIKCANPLMLYPEEMGGDAVVIARTLTGNACGFRKSLGKGTVIHLGTWTGFDTEGHKPMYSELLRQSGARLSTVAADNESIIVSERFTDEGSATLFIGNYYNEEHSGKVCYTHPYSGKEISIPYHVENITWPALYGVFSPVCLEVLPGLKILHSTSDILDIQVSHHEIMMLLMGDRDLLGEIVFEGARTGMILSGRMNDQEVTVYNDGSVMVFNYMHLHKKELQLIMTLTM